MPALALSCQVPGGQGSGARHPLFSQGLSPHPLWAGDPRRATSTPGGTSSATYTSAPLRTRPGWDPCTVPQATALSQRGYFKSFCLPGFSAFTPVLLTSILSPAARGRDAFLAHSEWSTRSLSMM